VAVTTYNYTTTSGTDATITSGTGTWTSLGTSITGNSWTLGDLLQQNSFKSYFGTVLDVVNLHYMDKVLYFTLLCKPDNLELNGIKVNITRYDLNIEDKRVENPTKKARRGIFGCDLCPACKLVLAVAKFENSSTYPFLPCFDEDANLDMIRDFLLQVMGVKQP